MMAFPAWEPADAGNALLAVARKVLFRPTIYNRIAKIRTLTLRTSVQSAEV